MDDTDRTAEKNIHKLNIHISYLFLWWWITKYMYIKEVKYFTFMPSKKDTVVQI